MKTPPPHQSRFSVYSPARVAGLLLLLVTTPPATQAAATAMQMAQAMDIPTNTIVSATFTQLANAEAANVALDWGTIPPQKGTNLAAFSTGKALDANSPGYSAPSPGTVFSTSHPSPVSGQTTCGGTEGPTAYDYSELTITLKAPTNAVAFSLKFNFFSVEYPEWICSAVNDRFMILLNSTAFTGDIARDGAGNAMTVNTAVFAVTSPAALTGTGMENQGAATGWLSTTNAVTEGETVTLKSIVFDALDGTGDSLALIDGFTWHIDAPPPVVQIEKAVALSWASIFGLEYQVQWSTEAAPDDWIDLGGPVVGNGTTNYVYDLIAPDPARFYRVVQLE